MNIQRYQIVKAVNTKEGLIPIWDSRITFQEDDVVGKSITLKGDFKEYFNFIECIYDLKTKKIEIGVELDSYPDENKMSFKKGEVVFYEKSHRHISEATIADVIYEEYDLRIIRGKKMDNYEISLLKRAKNVTVEKDAIYAIKNWKPFYILDNGEKISWEHQLYHKAK